MNDANALLLLKETGIALGMLGASRVLIDAHLLGFNRWKELRWPRGVQERKPREWSPRSPVVKAVQGTIALMGLKLEEEPPTEQTDAVKVGLRIVYRALEILKGKQAAPEANQLIDIGTRDFMRDEDRRPRLQ